MGLPSRNTSRSTARPTPAVLASHGFEVATVAVDGHGRLDPADLTAGLAGGAAVVALAAVNHELGVVTDLPALAPPIRAAGARLVVDAVQAAGRLPLSPIAPSRFSVPGRRPRSWWPPPWIAASSTPGRSQRAPTPAGPPSLWADSAIASARSASGASGIRPAAWTASTTRRAPARPERSRIRTGAQRRATAIARPITATTTTTLVMIRPRLDTASCDAMKAPTAAPTPSTRPGAHTTWSARANTTTVPAM